MAHTLNHSIVWCDIPCQDLDRAIGFYTALLGRTVEKQDAGGMSLGVLPHGDQEVGGCLIVHESQPPSAQGLLVYFNVTGRINEAVQAATERGGQVLQPVHSIGPHGFRALLLDSEGNRIAVHSPTN